MGKSERSKHKQIEAKQHRQSESVNNGKEQPATTKQANRLPNEKNPLLIYNNQKRKINVKMSKPKTNKKSVK